MEVDKSQRAYIGSIASSARASGDIMEILQTQYFKKGVCKAAPLTQSGKRLQLIKMLCLNVLPILCLWGYTLYTLTDSINSRQEHFKTRTSIYHSIDLGKLVHRLQVERDMNVLYLSTMGPGTNIFLMAEYANTDLILQQITWPTDLDDKTSDVMFISKSNFMRHLDLHRQSPGSHSLQSEIDFYSTLIDKMISWLYNTITENKFSAVWKILVAYQKLSSAKENLGVERALGTMFYAQGGFVTSADFENYNKRLYSFRAYMRSIGMYSNVVNDINNTNNAKLPDNFTNIIESFRREIQTNVHGTAIVDTQKAKYFFDNMTIYLNTLFDIQSDLAAYIVSKFGEIIDDLTRDLIINAVLLVVVILLCPVVILATENLTSSIQAYALTLVDKTKELTNEKRRTDGLLYQMVPKEVANMLKRKIKVNAEYFKMVTICFSDVQDFDKLTVELTPLEMVQLLNELYNTIDDILDDFDVYKVETINDCYMVASGLPKRNKDRHAVEIADFALRMLGTVSRTTFLSNKRHIQLRIGINSGPCMAGVVGLVMPRYCLFGDTVNTASRMKAYSNSNQIHISHSTYLLLRKCKSFTMKKRGSVSVKGKGDMRTYWLMGKIEDYGTPLLVSDEDSTMSVPQELPGEITKTGSYPMLDKLAHVNIHTTKKVDQESIHDKGELPGEITTIESPTYSASLNYPMPGRTSNKIKKMSMANHKHDSIPNLPRSTVNLTAISSSTENIDAPTSPINAASNENLAISTRSTVSLDIIKSLDAATANVKTTLSTDNVSSTVNSDEHMTRSISTGDLVIPINNTDT